MLCFICVDNLKSPHTLFQSEGIHTVQTPFQAPNANAYAERWVRSVRGECLDKLIIVNDKHLTQVMNEYVTYFNTARPHQGIEQQIPIAPDISNESGLFGVGMFSVGLFMISGVDKPTIEVF